MQLAYSSRFPLPGRAEVARHAGQLLPATEHARTPDPVESRSPAKSRLAPARWMAIEGLESWKSAVVRIRPDARVEESQTMYPSVNDVQRTFGVSWDQLVELEPELETLLGRMRVTKPSRCPRPLHDDRVAPAGN